MDKSSKSLYKRILLKLSGEALMNLNSSICDNSVSAFDSDVVSKYAAQISEVFSLGVQIGIVIGGGNFIRGSSFRHSGVSRVTADYMGMLATVMNALAFRDILSAAKIPVKIMSAIPVLGLCETFSVDRAKEYIENNIVIFAGGTGNPLVTTDSAASLRGIQIDADAMIKATGVDGVYSSDPKTNADAKKYTSLSFSEAIKKELAVMDVSAFHQCRDHNLEIRVFDINEYGALMKVITSYNHGTVIRSKEA